MAVIVSHCVCSSASVSTLPDLPCVTIRILAGSWLPVLCNTPSTILRTNQSISRWFYMLQYIKLCFALTNLWLTVGVWRAELEAGSRTNVSRWTVIYKANIAFRCVCALFYKSELTLAYAISGFCAYVLFLYESYTLFNKWDPRSLRMSRTLVPLTFSYSSKCSPLSKLLKPLSFWCSPLHLTSIALLSVLGEGSLTCGSLWGFYFLFTC